MTREKGPKVSRNKIPDKTLTAEDNDLLTVALNLLDDSVRARIAGDVPLAARKNKQARSVLKHLIADRVIEKPDEVIPLITGPGEGGVNPVNVRVAGKEEKFVAIEMHFRTDEPDFIEIRMQQMEAFLREKGIQPPQPPKGVFTVSTQSSTMNVPASAGTHDYSALDNDVKAYIDEAQSLPQPVQPIAVGNESAKYLLRLLRGETT